MLSRWQAPLFIIFPNFIRGKKNPHSVLSDLGLPLEEESKFLRSSRRYRLLEMQDKHIWIVTAAVGVFK